MGLTFSVELADLRKSVNFVRNGLGNLKTDLANLLIKMSLKGNTLQMFAANNEMFCRTEMKVSEQEGEGVFSVLGSKMEKLISQVEAEKATFAVDEENVEIKASFLTVNFELYDGVALSTMEGVCYTEAKGLEGLAVLKDVVEEALVCAKTCVVQTSIRSDITHVELRDKRMLSSDGRKIMIFSSESFPKDLAVKIPGSVLTAVVSAVKNMDVEHLEIVEGKSYYYVKADRLRFLMGFRKVSRVFPFVEETVMDSAGFTDQVSLDKGVFESMLRGVALGLPTDEVKINLVVKGEAKEAVVEVSALNSLGRKSWERASCGRTKSEVGEMVIPISFRHLLDTVGVFKGDSVVDLIVMKGKKVLQVVDKTDVREVLTVIPWRTQEAMDEEKKAKLEESKVKTDKEPVDMEQVADV